MNYRLQKLAAGSYDVIHHGVIIASLVRQGTYSSTWIAELLVYLKPGERPAPFMEQERQFQSLEAACQWLGITDMPSGLRSQREFDPS